MKQIACTGRSRRHRRAESGGVKFWATMLRFGGCRRVTACCRIRDWDAPGSVVTDKRLVVDWRSYASATPVKEWLGVVAPGVRTLPVGGAGRQPRTRHAGAGARGRAPSRRGTREGTPPA